MRLRRRHSMPRVFNRAARTGHGTPLRRLDAPHPESPVDSMLLFVVVTLAMVGLTVVYSATYHEGSRMVLNQLLRAGVGLAALLVGVRLRHTALAGWLGWVLLGLVFGLLAATVVFGRSVGVATRWLGIIQPSEIAKFVLPMWLAAYFARLKGEHDRAWGFVNTIVKPGIVVALFVGLTAAQPAIGTTAIMAVSSLALFFVVGVKLRYLVPVAALVVAALALAVKVTGYADHRGREFLAGECEQQQQSLIAIGSGGPVGKGLGEGKQKFYFLPKLHTDFAIASIGEEFGFLGTLIVAVLYAVFLIRGMHIGRNATHHFGQYLCSGIAITIFMYAVVHFGVALRLLPVTGQPLPFVSYGGSALVTNLFAAGVMLNVSRFSRRNDEGNALGGRHRGARLSRSRTRR